MSWALFSRSVREAWVGLLGWGIGLALLAFLVVASFPEVGDSPELEQFYQNASPTTRSLLGNVESLTSLEGYLYTQLFLFLPILLGIYATVRAARAVAGEEEAGTIDLLMAQPIERWQVVVSKGGAMMLLTLILAEWTALVTIGGLWIYGVDFDPLLVVVAALNAVPAAVMTGSLAMIASCLWHRMRYALALGIGYVVGSYFVFGLGPLVEWLAAIRGLSVYWWFAANDPLTSTFAALDLALLLVVSLGLLLLAVAAMQRKDLGV